MRLTLIAQAYAVAAAAESVTNESLDRVLTLPICIVSTGSWKFQLFSGCSHCMYSLAIVSDEGLTHMSVWTQETSAVCGTLPETIRNGENEVSRPFGTKVTTWL